MKSLPQLYRFCFLMTGDATKAQEVFQATMHEAALRAAQGELPATRSFSFAMPAGVVSRHVRPRCSRKRWKWKSMRSRLGDPRRLPSWSRSSWPSGWRARPTATERAAFFYLDHFTNEEILDLLDLEEPEFSHLIAVA